MRRPHTPDIRFGMEFHAISLECRIVDQPVVRTG
jgi:hypothetical protein